MPTCSSHWILGGWLAGRLTGWLTIGTKQTIEIVYFEVGVHPDAASQPAKTIGIKGTIRIIRTIGNIRRGINML